MYMYLLSTQKPIHSRFRRQKFGVGEQSSKIVQLGLAITALFFIFENLYHRLIFFIYLILFFGVVLK
jgi:hypothetical protein